MSTVIKVENLSKRYRIGMKEKRADTFAGQVMNVLRSPLDNFRQLRSLSRFREDDESVFWALRDINFEVKEGEVLGIIGHNGAGKSTLLKILSRITEPTTGSVKLRGRVSALLEVGTGFHPELTGRENIYMNGTILGMTRREIDRKLDEIVDFSGVEKHIDTPVKFYSSGMKVRLGFAVAAHLEPEILIIDEVLAVGDAEFQRKCLGKMEDVATQGRTVLFVSHDMGAMSVLAKGCISLEQGQILNNGSTEKVIRNYLSRSVNSESQNHFKVISDLSIKINAGNNWHCNNLIDFGSDIVISCGFKSKETISNVFLFFRIENEKGEVISTVHSADCDFQVNLEENLSTFFKFTVDKIGLLPGIYYLTFALQNQFKEVLDVAYNLTEFEILKLTGPERFKTGSNRAGKLYLFGKWTH